MEKFVDQFSSANIIKIVTLKSFFCWSEETDADAEDGNHQILC